MQNLIVQSFGVEYFVFQAMARSKSKSFRAVLEATGDRLKWVVLRLPFDGVKFFGKRGQIKVRGEINGFLFRTSLFPDGKGGHMMCVNKQMQKGGNVSPGAIALLQMEMDTEERIVTVPSELKRALAEDKSLVKYYGSLSYSFRKEIARYVAEARHEETREKRAEQMAERLMLVLEGEHELPPVLRAAIAHNPKALAGWEKMSPSQKRRHLFGIFYYNNPESRARRVAKAVEMMEARAAKTNKKQ